MLVGRLSRSAKRTDGEHKKGRSSLSGLSRSLKYAREIFGMIVDLPDHERYCFPVIFFLKAPKASCCINRNIYPIYFSAICYWFFLASELRIGSVSISLANGSSAKRRLRSLFGLKVPLFPIR